MKRFLYILLLIFLLVPAIGCGGKSDAIQLSFKSASKYDYLKTLDGKKVSIDGYMATMSPVDKSFIFLMNLPYQSCPFCKPNTSELSNTIEVYPATGVDFSYNPSPIRIVGTLKVASVNNPFTDSYGYEFSFKIVDADYTIITDSELQYSQELYSRLSDSGLIADMYAMYNYLSFLCTWPEYFVNSYFDAAGNKQPGYYLYASDALYHLDKPSGQYHYGRADGYFDDLLLRFANICGDNFVSIQENIMKCKELAEYAYSELVNEHYTSKFQYLDKFDNYDYVFTLNDETLKTQFENLYQEFSDALGEL